MRADDDAVDALRGAHRAASDAVDDAPDPGVRAAVLAAALRGVGAQPRRLTAASTDARPSAVRRWPLSAAALLVVSIIAGLVGTRVMRSAPEPATTIASVTPTARTAPTAPSSGEAASPPAAPSAPSQRAPASAGPAIAATATSRPQQRQQATRNESRPRDLRASADRAEASIPLAAAAAPAPAREAPPLAAAPQTQALAKTEQSADVASREETTQASDADASSFGTTTAMRARIGRTAEPATPEAWVARIVRLRADGNDGEADRELAGLRRRYPDFSVPTSALRASGTR